MTIAIQPLACALVLALLAGSAGAAQNPSPAPAMQGFSAARAAAQADLERRFDAQLDTKDQRAWLQQMSSEPNQVGSPHDKANADFMLAQFTSWGWDARIETFDVLYPTPKSVALEMLAPNAFTAKLHEPAIDGDATSGKSGMLPPYNVYGADGDVTGELVYANYGMPDDYKALAQRGIDVKGRIVITRYGGGWRGLKPKLAYEHGAIGCLIYSDPHDDGYQRGDTYPKGGFRPADGVQRGSVQDMQQYPGDPLTPNVGATKDAKRLSIAEAKTILKIPVLPISYADAQPLLAALDGPVAPPDWRGALPITYHIGPGAAKVHLAISSDWSQKPIYDVIAVMKGSRYPDQWVVRGNHHDGWVFGAWDPLAGNVALMAEVKAIGALAKSGWRPQRTLVYASWDAEEPGLLGSTEWAEAHADELKKKAVVYVNSDTNGRGFLGAEGSHSLQHHVNEVANDVMDPQTQVSVMKRLRAKLQVDALDKNASEERRRLAKFAASTDDVPIGALGSGSDYSAFLQHLGIASLDLGFGGEDDQGGVYHSAYDSFDHYARFGDPTFEYGVALSKTAGRVVLRMADADVVPMRFTDFADTVGRYVDELVALADRERERTEALHKLIDADAFKLAADPTRPLLAPERESDVPHLNLSDLQNAVTTLRDSAKAYDRALAAATTDGKSLSPAQLGELNATLQSMEQALTDDAGLPGRPWFKHFVYAPGLLTGYGVKTLPGVREAIEARNWGEANRYSGLTANVLLEYATRLDRVNRSLHR